MSDLLVMLFSYVVYSGKLQREQFSTVPIFRKTAFSNRELGWRSHMGWACFLKQREISLSPYSTYWQQAFLRMEMDIIPFCKWGSWAANLMAFHAKATGKNWVGFGFLPPPTPGCCGSLKIERGRGNLMTLWYVTVLVQWYMSALKGKISSVIFTMVHICTMTGPIGLNQRILSHVLRWLFHLLRSRCLLL